MKPIRVTSPTNYTRLITLILLGALVTIILVIKSFNDNGFEPQKPLEVKGQPMLVFFTLADGCECQMVVIRSAETQLAEWPFMQTGEFSVQRVDYDHRPDMISLYNVARAPALVLLDAAGEVVWKQDLGLSDEAPLDLTQAQDQIETLLSGSDQ